MDARPLAGALQAALGVLLGIDHQMAEPVAQRDEIAFGVDDGLLHPGGTLLQQTPQQMRFAGARIALHQQAGRQQLLEIQRCRGACGRVSHLDRNGHARLRRSFAVGLINRITARRAPMWPPARYCASYLNVSGSSRTGNPVDSNHLFTMGRVPIEDVLHSVA